MKMIIFRMNVKQNIRPAIILLLCVFVLTFQGCKRKRSDMAKILFKQTRNELFKKLEPDDYAVVFKKVLDSVKQTLNYPQLISTYYSKNNYEPVFVEQHLQNNDLYNMVDFYEKANEHGFDPKMFHPEEIRALIDKFRDKRAIKNVDEAYHVIAELEILTANSLVKYSNDVQYGVVNPKWIYARYFTATKRPDTTSMLQPLQAKNIKTYLDSIQPKDPQYIALQKAFVNDDVIPGLSLQESHRVLLVNLERLRWKNKPTENKYVYVNIPDYRLDVMDSGRSVLNMKVCVGQGRNMDNAKTLMHYDDTDKVDKPNPHETPLLNSMIHSVEVNPIWNIPESIANKEIIVEAQKDPYYLSNKNIDVYKDDKKVDDSESIDWATADKSDYSFKQEPGEDNSLGKIKFLFNNKSNVYLHDTPAKSAFFKKMRAISHGCVRLGQPLDLAHNLFGDGKKYDEIAKDMGEDNPDPTTIYFGKRVPVYITYVTCWADTTGTLQYRPDVYGLDIVLFANLQKVIGD